MEYTGVVDDQGVGIYVGDTIRLRYITPLGDILDEYNDDSRTVEKKYGCYGFQTAVRFIPLMDLMKTSKGEYVSNAGNVVVYGEFLGRVVKSIKKGGNGMEDEYKNLRIFENELRNIFSQ